ncbi:MBL fold metallo-hydrolase [Phyllobacterium sp. BT25]|uniref:MBL fold metallo-hydrolase n=1 Tax=Phyllobacterium pellucidum TaxID=2740464 RepID=A0A849VVE1_9HYPH|nr:MULTISPECIES: MBL fold metallo-hydrolase [Phyllobacterium]NTS33955.1 MBL fold metallo-hydrolase [Phyllobacterium pellucidum]SFJ14579.1 phosphoribosyl 1,2-cyclic phosphate phosphodiesterase [Phyllobacterium sp. CL33Tsu]
MPDRLRFTILGCGSSPGVPRINGDWGKCDPVNPKNRRRRASMLVERISENGGVTTVIIDTGPDFRSQMIDFGSGKLDAVVYTHPHADHIHGLDDLRTFVIDRRDLFDIYADAQTLTRLYDAFGYCFKTPEGSSYPPILRPHEIIHDESFAIEGAGGAIRFLPLPQIHGDIVSLGFRIADIAYCSDVSAFPAATASALAGLDTLVIDALQYRTHPSHFSLEESIEWIDKLKPRRAILTHMHVPLDYETVMRETPDHVEPAFDGLTFEVNL